MTSIPISQVTREWLGLQAGALSAADGWRLVPVLRRAVELRSEAIRAMPFRLLDRAGRDVTDSERGTAHVANLRRQLGLIELAYLLTGRAYCLIETNLAGRNPTPRWVLSSSMTINQNGDGTIRDFTRTAMDGSGIWPLERVLWWFAPSITDETLPGPAPIEAALAAAGALQHQAAFVGMYFQTVAPRALIAKTKGNPGASDKARLTDRLFRLFDGRKRIDTLPDTTTLETVGDPLVDSASPELTNQQRADVLMAVGVPASMVLPSAANFAVAQQDAITFWNWTIRPRWEAGILPELQRWAALHGWRIESDYSKLEVVQAQQLAQAQAVGALTGGPIMTVDEGRAWIGLPPLPAPTRPAAEPAPADAPAQPAPADQPDTSQPGQADAARAADLERWERKAMKRLREKGGAGCDFTSSHISEADARAIRWRLERATTPAAVRAAFKADLTRTLRELEQRLYSSLALVLATHGSATATRIMRGQTVDLAGMDEELRAALLAVLAEVFAEQITDLEATWALALPVATETTSAAAAWAEAYTYGLIKGLTSTTQTIVARAVATFARTPGMTRAQLEAALAPAFGPVRAEAIAITETTRAAAAAQNEYQRQAIDAGIPLVRVWRTAHDEDTCPICKPLNGLMEAFWAADYPDGPPAHPRCRCAQTLMLEPDE